MKFENEFINQTLPKILLQARSNNHYINIFCKSDKKFRHRHQLKIKH